MTVKTLKKQLAAAIAMVLVSVIALSSSTYAWFASNSKVEATGMQVKAKAEGGIEIAYDTSSSYSTSATAGMDTATELLPTSTEAGASAGAIATWYHASAERTSSYAAKSGTYTVLELTDGKDDSNNYYYVKKHFKIRAVSSSLAASDLKVSGITVTGSSVVLSKALRIAVVCGDNTAVYAPVGYAQEDTETGITYNVATAVNASGEATMGTNNVTALYANQTSAVIADSVTNSGVDAYVYIWFEGEDTNLKSDNAGTLDTLSITVNFDATI